jgi:hypothetical protein
MGGGAGDLIGGLLSGGNNSGGGLKLTKNIFNYDIQEEILAI